MAKKKAISKKTRKKPAKSEDDFFASVNNPELVRLSVLETRRAVLESMKNFKELMEIRKNKIHEKANLKKNLRNISSLLTKIKSALPKVKTPSGDVMDLSSVPDEEVQKTAPSHHEELDRIEAELSDIDNQLAGL